MARNISFFTGESPRYFAEISRAFKNAPRMSTPDGHAAWQEPHSRHLSSLFRTPWASEVIFPAKSESSDSLPRATSDSLMDSANTGHTDWHVPHFMHAESLSSSFAVSSASFASLSMSVSHHFRRVEKPLGVGGAAQGAAVFESRLRSLEFQPPGLRRSRPVLARERPAHFDGAAEELVYRALDARELLGVALVAED